MGENEAPEDVVGGDIYSYVPSAIRDTNRRQETSTRKPNRHVSVHMALRKARG